MPGGRLKCWAGSTAGVLFPSPTLASKRGWGQFSQTGHFSLGWHWGGRVTSLPLFFLLPIRICSSTWQLPCGGAFTKKRRLWGLLKQFMQGKLLLNPPQIDTSSESISLWCGCSFVPGILLFVLPRAILSECTIRRDLQYISFCFKIRIWS